MDLDTVKWIFETFGLWAVTNVLMGIAVWFLWTASQKKDEAMADIINQVSEGFAVSQDKWADLAEKQIDGSYEVKTAIVEVRGNIHLLHLLVDERCPKRNGGRR